MLLLALILSLTFLSVSSIPAQLRLSHSGYEIISLSEPRQGDDEIASARTSPKLPMRNASRYNDLSLVNLERAKDSSDEIDEMPMEAMVRRTDVQYEPHQRSSSGSKAASEMRQNAIELASKVSSSGSSGSRASNVYLALGMPRRSINPKNQRQDSFNSLQSSDNTDWRVKQSKIPDYGDYRYEDPRKTIVSRIKDKKHKTGVQSKSGFVQVDATNEHHRPTSSDESRKNDHRSDREAAFNANRIKALAVDAHRSLDFLLAKTDSREKIEHIESFESTSGARKIADSPASNGNQWLAASGVSGIRSPVNSVGFDVIASDSRDKSTIVPLTSLSSKSSASVEPKPIVGRFGVESAPIERKDTSSHESNGLGSSERTSDLFGSWNRERMNRRVSLKDAANGVKDESPSFQSQINGMIIKLAALVPYGGTMSSSILPLDPRNRGHPQINPYGSYVAKHAAPDPFAVYTSIDEPHGHSDELGHAIGLGKVGPRDHDGSWKHRAHRPKDNDDKFNLIDDARPNLVVDILHEMKPDYYYEGARNSLDKQDEKVRRDVQDSSSGSRGSNGIAGSKCKKIKNSQVSLPAFYQFVANFSASVLDNVLRYETIVENNNRENGRKNRMTDNEIAKPVRSA